MLFPTLTFALFFAVVLGGSWALMRRRRAWRLFILAANAVFYGSWDWRFLGLLAGAIAMNQAFAVAIGRSAGERTRRRLLIAAVVADLGVLGFFKYHGFFVLSAERALHRLGLGLQLPLLDVVLPVGISFFTFMALSYVVQVYQRRISVGRTLDVAIYLSFFPTLLAGPIVRGSELLPQLARPRDPARVPTAWALRLIAGGLVKKVIFADTLARLLVDPVFTHPGDFGAPQVLLGIYGYAIQIYCDFSAYSDIAIGVAALLGFRLPDNFDSPYAATSIRDFWRRWHMTLSRWLRDYLYIPLGGSRRGRGRTHVNLLITMLLGGLWHGALWKFVLWGGLHGGWLAAERALRERGWLADDAALADSPARRWLRRTVVFHLVCFAWVFFRADSMDAAWTVLAGLAGDWGIEPSLAPVVYAVLFGGLAIQFVPRDILPRLDRFFTRAPVAVQGLLLALFLLALDVLGPQGVAGFIYFQF